MGELPREVDNTIGYCRREHKRNAKDVEEVWVVTPFKRRIST
jgi:hypothetical protein